MFFSGIPRRSTSLSLLAASSRSFSLLSSSNSQSNLCLLRSFYGRGFLSWSARATFSLRLATLLSCTTSQHGSKLCCSPAQVRPVRASTQNHTFFYLYSMFTRCSFDPQWSVRLVRFSFCRVGDVIPEDVPQFVFIVLHTNRWIMHRTGTYRRLSLIFGIFPFISAVLLALMREDSPQIQQWLSIVRPGRHQLNSSC